MLTYPNIDPIALTLGPLQVHWYGLMYLLGFAGGWWLGRIQARRPGSGWTLDQVDDLVFYTALGVVLGGRVGYILFYNLPGFLADPIELFRVTNGGMSFHGGLLGVLFAMWLLGRKQGRTFFETTDFVAPIVTIGLGTGRIGNFINGELWGKTSDLPWAMVFPGAGPIPRHPSQLYEALLEGLVLFLILWTFSRRTVRPVRAISGLFLVSYAVIRWLIEFVRIPDSHLGYLAFDWLTMGQILTLPMLLFGIYLLWSAYRTPRFPAYTIPKGTGE